MGWIENNYRSRRGLVREMVARATWRFQPDARTRRDLSAIRRLVFVCKGNICRSAMGEAVARSLDFPTCSYGLATTPGKPADDQMLRVAKALSYDLSEHQTTRFDDYDPAAEDLVLFFEREHMLECNDRSIGIGNFALLGMWASPKRPHIPDPFGGPEAYFMKVAGVIRQSVNSLADEIRRSDKQ